MRASRPERRPGETALEFVLGLDVIVHCHCASHPDLPGPEDTRRGVRRRLVDEPVARGEELAGLPTMSVLDERAIDEAWPRRTASQDRKSTRLNSSHLGN